MKADTFTLEQVFGLTTRYVVPLYQRPYVWNLEQQWEPLWQDVVAISDRLTDESADNDEVPHFMGAIVLAQTWSQALKTSRLVIDGQQRLTTLQLLMAAVRDVAHELGEQSAMKQMASLLLIEDYLVDDPEQRHKLVPTNADRWAFAHAIAGDPGKMPKPPEGEVSERTLAAYRYFVSVARAWATDPGDDHPPAARVRALAKALRQLMKVVVIDLEPRDNAQAIFETLNARGQPLLAADLVKNYVFQRAEAARRDVAQLYEAYWKPFDFKPWRNEVGQGRVRRPRIDVFLTYWLTMKSEGEVSWQQLFDDFRRWADDAKPDVEHLLADLTENAQIFDGFDAYPVGSPEQLFFYRLGVLEANTAFPVVLWMFGPQGIRDDEDRRRALRFIESWLVRRQLRRLTTKAYNQVFLALLKHLAGQPEPSSEHVREFLEARGGDSQVWPADDEVLLSLRSLPYYQAILRGRLRMVLEALEADMRGALVGPFTAWGSLSIEHVLPQEWRTHWQLPDGADPLAAGIERDTAKHRLGNLSLVTHPLNSSLSNAPWTAPGEMPSKREALREFNVLMLNKSLVDLDHWDESLIEKRTEQLAQRILRIWPGPARRAPAVREDAAPFEGIPTPVHAALAVEPTTGSGPRPDNDGDLSASFHDAMIDLYKRAKADAGYNATYFLAMVSDVGGLETARRLVRSPNASDGYVALWERKRLDLSVEATVLHPKWLSLFNEDEVAAARERLLSYGFDLDGYLSALHSNATAQPSAATQVTTATPVAPAVTEVGARYQRFFELALARFKQLRPGITSASRISTDSWFGFSAGRSGFQHVWAFARGRRLRVELYIDMGDRDRNKAAFDVLAARDAELVAAIGQPIAWERLDDRQACRVAVYYPGEVDQRFDEDAALVDWAAETMVRTCDAYRPLVQALAV